MTGLMYHRPADHLNYLQECLEKIKKQGISGVRWDLFLETQTASPPPATPKKGKEETVSKIVLGTENLSKYDPLPGIDSLRVKIRPNASIICVLAGPGVNKSNYSQGLINHYPTFVHLHMGDLLRNRAKLETQRKSSRWVDSYLKINAGELLPHIGFDRLACVFLIDAAEEFCKYQLKERGQQDEFWKDNTPAAIENRICLFKLQTLPVCKCIDNDGKLRVVDGEIKPEHIARDMLTVCEFVLSGKVTGPTSRPAPGSISERPPDRVSHGMTGCPGQPPVFNIPRIVPQFPDKGRVADLYTCPVILLFEQPIFAVQLLNIRRIPPLKFNFKSTIALMEKCFLIDLGVVPFRRLKSALRKGYRVDSLVRVREPDYGAYPKL
ncbi:unnamed protein product [Echinostoma caproni]|uniref:Adenylate kinase n=1 Tax=Echinostoma caproni TaxID=27848 RepID=A0A183AWQ2_9TREM|nr:unnamed protein product [Echinostoma caproni]